MEACTALLVHLPVQIPKELLSALSGVEGFNRDAFVEVHETSVSPTSIRVNSSKAAPELMPFTMQPVPWCREGYYLDKRPSFTFDPLFHAGCYYVQEASSMFLEQALVQTTDLSRPLKVLDLCAAPGGKSTHLQSLISGDSLLVSNEVIKPRSGILKQNITRWGSSNVVVTSNDPKHFHKLAGFFDVIVADAPCSGSGLFRKDPAAIDEWSPELVQLCSGRQRRILADVLPALAEGGLLIYSTCSYSKEENEEIGDWLVGEMGMESIVLEVEPSWGVIPVTNLDGSVSGYRFYPDKAKGEGFFLACFRKRSPSHTKEAKVGKAATLSRGEKDSLKPWIAPDAALEYLKHEQYVFALPYSLVSPFLQVQSALYIQYAGTACGMLIRDKLVPDHALAVSPILNTDLPSVALDYEDSIRYLQRNDLHLAPEFKGWQTVRYKGQSLGWVNVLANRVNNYYPKELRILKRDNDSDFEKYAPSL